MKIVRVRHTRYFLLLIGVSIVFSFIAMTVVSTAKVYAGYWCYMLPNPFNASAADNVPVYDNAFSAHCNSGDSDGTTASSYQYADGLSSVVAQSPDSKKMKAAFISLIKVKSSGYGFQQVSASYIKNGLDGGTGTWETRVNNPNVTLSIESYTYTINTVYDMRTQSIVTYSDSATSTALVFRVGGVVRYVIKVDCGNPLGTLPGLPYDECPNLPGDQASVPPGYVKDSFGNCDLPPTGSVGAGDCATATVLGTAKDPDYGGEIIVDVYGDGPAGGGGTFISSIVTSGHNFTFVDTQDRPKLITMGRTYYFYAIGRTAGGASNGVNTLIGTKNIGPCNKSACGTTNFAASSRIVGIPYSFNVSVKLDAWRSPPYTASSNPKLYITLNGPAGATSLNLSAAAYTVSGPAVGTGKMPAQLTATATYTPLVSGTYTMTWGLVGPGLNISCPSSGGIPTSQAYYAPYFEVNGGDILSGDFIRSWNGDNDPAWGIGYNGAGTNLAALAAGNITSFVTGIGLAGGVSAQSGHGLAFANTTFGGGTYGGEYSVPAYVPPVSSSAPTASPGSLNVSAIAAPGDYSYTYNGDLTVYGQLQPGVHLTITLASGNLYVANPGVSYASYSTADTVPKFSVFVMNGNIYIDNDVSTTQGIYYAGGAGKGNFYSCSYGLGSAVNLSAGSAYADCYRKLIVYGAVAANKLVLSRTWGNLGSFRTPGSVAAEPAEVFLYSPELWLGRSPSSSATGPLTYDAYVSLPPLL